MADLMPCPSCKATLRVPPGAERIRCPQCKSQVTVPSDPIPVAKAIPQPKPAIPLPFDRPAPAAAAIPTAKALPPEKPVVRGRVVREEEDEEAKKPRRRSREETDTPRYRAMDKLCWNARLGVKLLAIGAGESCGTALCYGAFLGSIAIASTLIPALLWLALLGLALRSLFFIAGYIGCLFGPKGMRSTAVMGIIITMLHAALIIPLAIYGFALLASTYGGGNMPSDTEVSRVVFIISSMMNNLNSLTDFPFMFLRGDFKANERLYVAMMIVGSLLEFGMMSVLGTMVHYYATEGKGHELGFRSLKFVYRIIWVIIVVGLVKLMIMVGFQFFVSEGFANQFFRIPHTLLTVGYFLWWAFAWYEQYTSMNESLTVITPGRYLDKRINLDPL